MAGMKVRKGKNRVGCEERKIEVGEGGDMKRSDKENDREGRRDA